MEVATTSMKLPEELPCVGDVIQNRITKEFFLILEKPNRYRAPDTREARFYRDMYDQCWECLSWRLKTMEKREIMFNRGPEGHCIYFDTCDL
jgi:hypothetical protein